MILKSNEKTDTNKVELVVSVDAETFEKAVNTVFKKQSKDIQIAGFRKGKAPRHIVEKMYGEGAFYEDAMQECYPEALEEAIKEADLNVVAVEKLECEEVGKDGFTFKSTVVTYPEVEIKDYKGIEVSKKSVEVTDELIDEEIEKVRDRNSRMVTVEDRAAENDDTAVIDFEGFVDGVAFEGGKAENHNLLLGSNQFIPGFEEQIVGHKTGEEFTITVSFPEDYQAEDLKGKEAEFKIVLHEIKKKELPEVDDEFVKDVSEKDTVAEYRDELKEEIAKRLEDEANRDYEDQVINALCEKVEGEIPEQMYDNTVEEMLRDMDMRLRQQGMDLNTYIQYMGGNVDSIKEMYKPEAEKRVKLRLALEKIAENEKVEATEEELEDEYKSLSEAYKMEIDQVKAAISTDALTQDIVSGKAMDLVKDSTKEK